MSSLVVSCQCGQAFAASPELAGQTLACPACGSPLTVGSPALTPAPQFAPLAPAGFDPGLAHQGFGGGGAAMPGFGAPAPGYGGAPAGFGGAAPVPGFGAPAFGAPQSADPFAMPGYGQPNYGAMPTIGGGAEMGASTTVKALIGVAIGVVVLLVGAIAIDQLFVKKSGSQPSVAAAPVAPTPAPAAPVSTPMAAPAPKPTPTPAPTTPSAPAPAPVASTPPPAGTEAYTVPGSFTIFAPTGYFWQANPPQSLGRGVTANAYMAVKPDGSGLTVSIINTPIKSQSERRDFLKGASNGLSRGVPGAQLLNSQGFQPIGVVPDRVEVQLTLQGVNGVQVHGKGFINFGKKRTAMVVAMAQDITTRDQLMQSVNSYKDL